MLAPLLYLKTPNALNVNGERSRTPFALASFLDQIKSNSLVGLGHCGKLAVGDASQNQFTPFGQAFYEGLRALNKLIFS